MENNGPGPTSRGAILSRDEPILITGAAGFIGSHVLASLVRRGFRHIRCLVRPSSDLRRLQGCGGSAADNGRIQILTGNLLSPEDCVRACQDVVLVLHLAAARGQKSFADAFLNSVVTTRNLLDACLQHKTIRRIVSVSSLSVYSNREKPHHRILDESCPIDTRPELRGDAYSFAKVKQDDLVRQYGQHFGIPYVMVRPGFVYGPGNESITGRVGIHTLGIFLHMGGSNPIPLAYVDNCAEAIVLAGLAQGVDGEIFNVVDDDLPTSRQFLRLYKAKVRHFFSIYLPPPVSYAFCWAWEKYSQWSEDQLPPVFNRRMWHVYWKRTSYSNRKLKERLNWTPKVNSAEALERYFDSCRQTARHA